MGGRAHREPLKLAWFDTLAPAVRDWEFFDMLHIVRVEKFHSQSSSDTLVYFIVCSLTESLVSHFMVAALRSATLPTKAPFAG